MSVKSQKPSQKKKAAPEQDPLTKQQKERIQRNVETAREFESVVRARVGILLRGAAAELDRACGWIGAAGSDADEVSAAVSAAITALSELRQERLDVWKQELRRLDAAREAWRNAGGEE